jgi:hypothetical protein
MTDTTAELDRIEADAHRNWQAMTALQRKIAPNDEYYRIPVDTRTVGQTLTYQAVSDATSTISRFADQLERIRLTLLLVEHGPYALASRSAPAPGPNAARLFAQTTAERRQFEF